MKSFICTFLTATLIVMSLASCNQKKNLSNTESGNNVVTKSEISKTEEIASSITYNNDCFSDRAVTNEVTDAEATMTLVMNMYMFSFENTRWQACEVPEAFHKEGMKVKVSGQVLEIRPNERRAGTPFNIISLSER